MVTIFRASLLFLLLFFSIFFINTSANTREFSRDSRATMVAQINHNPWQYYQELLTLSSGFSELDQEGKLWFLLHKAQAENLLYFYADFEKTLAQLQDLITADTTGEIQSHINFYAGVSAQRHSQYQQARELLRASILQASKEKLLPLYLQGKRHLAYTQSLTGLFVSSLTDLQTAYVEAVGLQDDLLMALINESYGAIYRYLGEYETSINYYQKALHVYQQYDYLGYIAEVIYGQGLSYLAWKKYDQAFSAFENFKESSRYAGNKSINFKAILGIASTFTEQSNCQEALGYIKKALKLAYYPYDKAQLYKYKARCLLHLNDYDNASKALTLAEKIYAQLPELMGQPPQLEMTKIAADLAYGQGSSEQGFQLLKEYYQKDHSMLMQKNSERLARLRAQQEVEKKNIEISLLHQKMKVHQLQEEQQRVDNEQEYLVLFAVCLTTLGLVVLILQQRHHRKLVALSIKDPLSDLYNRRYTFEFLEKRIGTRSASKGALSVILVDIDHFTHFNNLYGWTAGDDVICQMARILEDTLRAEDVIGRIRGEEFLCVLPRINAEQVNVIGQRLLENIQRYSFTIVDLKNSGHQSIQVKVTASIGVASTSKNLLDSAMLYIQANKALFRAKQNGKNQVEQYR